MNLPRKLPPVRGRGPIAEGFRVTWASINNLIDYCRSVTVKGGPNALTTRTSQGTTIVPNAEASEDARSGDGGDPRWS
jgi:hypothetical protein